MKRQLTLTALVASTVFGSGLANAHNNAHGAAHSFEDRARVTNVKEITKRTRTRTPRKECWNEQVETYQNCSTSYEEYDSHSSYGSSHNSGGYSGNNSGGYQQGAHDGTVGAVAGGAIGGAIGHQFGKGRGKKAATVVGAIAGAVIGAKVATGDRRHSSGHNDSGYSTGHSHSHNGHYGGSSRRCEPQYKTVRKCRTIYDDSYTNTVVGYRVTYRYKGQTYQTRTKNRPGRWIRLRVSISPIDE